MPMHRVVMARCTLEYSAGITYSTLSLRDIMFLKGHMKRHSDKQKFSCPCGKVYASQGTLTDHQLYKHPDGNMAPETKEDQTKRKAMYKVKARDRGVNLCAECGRTFSTPSALRLHSLIHTGIKPFVCKTCGFAFRVRAKLIAHERRHTGEKPFQCSTCGRRFRLNEVLKTHTLTHTGEKPFVCSVCNKRFRTRSHVMLHHQYQHVPDHERKRYTCERCGQEYLSSAKLVEHGARYHGDSHCVCSVCGKTYPCIRSLRCHMHVHNETALYQCSQCKSAFRWKASLRRHVRTAHGNKVVPMDTIVSELLDDNSRVICEPVLEQENLSDTIIFRANVSIL